MERERPPMPPLVIEPEILQFMQNRDIAPEDLPLIEAVAGFSNDLIIRELHNFFNFAGEKSAQQLRRQIEGAEEGSERKRLFEAVLAFVEKYDWAAAWNLIVVLERRKP